MWMCGLESDRSTRAGSGLARDGDASNLGIWSTTANERHAGSAFTGRRPTLQQDTVPTEVRVAMLLLAMGYVEVARPDRPLDILPCCRGNAPCTLNLETELFHTRDGPPRSRQPFYFCIAPAGVHIDLLLDDIAENARRKATAGIRGGSLVL